MRHYRWLLTLLASLSVGCGQSDDDVVEGGAASTADYRLPTRFRAGDEARDVPLLIAGRLSLENAYILERLSEASYFSSDPASRDTMLEAICDAGMQVAGYRCLMSADREPVTIDEFDSVDGDNHAIYVRAEAYGILAFRGTASSHNWMSDLSFPKETFAPFSKGNPSNDMEVHGGFYSSMKRVFDAPDPKHDRSLRDIVVANHGRADGTGPMPPPLYITGHSLGGAMAVHAVASLMMNECESFAAGENFGTRRDDAPPDELAWTLPGTRCPAVSKLNLQALYTYGTPRTGNKVFAQAVANLMAVRHVTHWRVVHQEDLLTLVPMRWLGFSHPHLNMKGVPERRQKPGEPLATFDLREDEDAELDPDNLPRINGRRGCGQQAGDPTLPKRCPVGSFVYLLPNPPKDEPSALSDLLRVGVGAKAYMDREPSRLPSLSDHLLGGYHEVLARAALRDSPAPSPSAACEDGADAIAEAAVRCGAGGPEARAAFIDTAAAGNCSNIVKVRNFEKFYGRCLPSLRSMSCDTLLGAGFDKACNSQLLRSP